MDSLLVLGAADGAVSTYVAARRLGYRTVCVDQNPAAPAVVLADEYLRVSTRDPDAIAARLGGRGDLVGVLAPASDVALPAQEVLNGRLGLAGSLNAATVAASTDKSHFREVCAELGFPTYRSGVDVSALDGLRMPVVVKPVDGTGSRGVRVCADRDAVTAAIRHATGHSPSARVIIEEYVAGSNHTVEAVVDDHQPVLVAITDRTITPPPYVISAAHEMPTTLPAATVARVREMVAALCKHLDYGRGPLNLDLVVDGDGEVHLIEMGARVGGNGMAELVAHCHGVDILAASIAAATDRPMEVTPRRDRPVMLHMLQAPRAGRLTAVDGLAEVSAWEAVRELRMFAEVGTAVAPYTEAANKLGYLLLSDADQAALPALAAAAERCLRIRVEADRQ